MTPRPRLRWPVRPRGGKRKKDRARRRSWLAFLAAFWPFMLGSVLVAGGLAAIVLGYVGVAGTVHVGLQLPYLVSGALLGLALVGLGSALLVLHALGRHARLMRRLLDEVRTAPPAIGEGPATAQGDGMVVAVRGAKRFHRPGCLMVEGKDVRRLRATTAVGRGLAPCAVCDPHAPGSA